MKIRLRSLLVGLASLALCPALFGCGDPAPPPNKYRVDVVAKGLEIPWSLALAPDGRLFVAERPGRIRVIARDSLLAEPWSTIDVFDGTPMNYEAGLMGLALDPDFSRHPYVYVCYTYQVEPGRRFNRVARLEEQGGHGANMRVLIDSIQAGPYHNGCRVKVGPDGKLYVTTGNAYVDWTAQSTSTLAGKVLRVNLDGSIPADNPIKGSPIWTLGHRNPQGIAWDRQGRAWVSEHGDGTIDEINLLERGANYGYPKLTGRNGNAEYRAAALVFHAAPSGAAILSDTAGDTTTMLVATLGGQRLMRLALRDASAAIADDSMLVGYGRLRDVIEGPDHTVYVATSNRDRRGTVRRGDDRILRVWLR